MSPATPNNQVTARFVRVRSLPWSVVAADEIGKIMSHAFKGFGGLFARIVKHVAHAAHDWIVATVLFVLDLSFAMILDHRVHRRASKHALGARHCSLICADINCSDGP